MIEVLPLRRLALSTRCKFEECFSSSTTKAIMEQTTDSLQEQGFCVYPHRLVSESTCRSLHKRIPKLFAGEFETGVYPDEWHWRCSITKPFLMACVGFRFMCLLNLTVSYIPSRRHTHAEKESANKTASLEKCATFGSQIVLSLP